MIKAPKKNHYPLAILSSILGLSVVPSSQAIENCLHNIQCPEAAGWEKVARSVVLIESNGIACTGTLLNNTAEDDTVYIASNGHCFSSKDQSNIVVGFNYEIACNADVDDPEVRPSNFQVLRDGYLVAWDPIIGVALIKFDEPIPEGANPYFAGWDLSFDASSEPHATIHHSFGGAKSFALANSGRTFYLEEAFSFQVPQSDDDYHERVWHTLGWDKGFIGSSSSGAGLFYGDEYLVGILGGIHSSEGSANTCDGSGQRVRHALLGNVWESDSSATPPIVPLNFSSFKEHLDPLNTGVTRLEGKELNTTP